MATAVATIGHPRPPKTRILKRYNVYPEYGRTPWRRCTRLAPNLEIEHNHSIRLHIISHHHLVTVRWCKASSVEFKVSFSSRIFQVCFYISSGMLQVAALVSHEFCCLLQLSKCSRLQAYHCNVVQLPEPQFHISSITFHPLPSGYFWLLVATWICLV